MLFDTRNREVLTPNATPVWTPTYKPKRKIKVKKGMTRLKRLQTLLALLATTDDLDQSQWSTCLFGVARQNEALRAAGLVKERMRMVSPIYDDTFIRLSRRDVIPSMTNAEKFFGISNDSPLWDGGPVSGKRRMLLGYIRRERAKLRRRKEQSHASR